MHQIAQNSGLDNEGNKYNKLRTHNLRSYFISTLHGLGYGIQDVHFLAGKSTGESFETYLSNYGTSEESIKVLKDKYISFMNNLMFTKQVDIELMTDKMKRYEKQIEKLIENNKDLSEKNEEMDKKLDDFQFQYKIDLEKTAMKSELIPFNVKIEDYEYNIKNNKRKDGTIINTQLNEILEIEKFQLECDRDEIKDYYNKRIEEIKTKGFVEEDITKNWNDEKEENLAIKEIAEKQIKERDEHVKKIQEGIRNFNPDEVEEEEEI
ncbi:MAG: hypothetical protein ACOCQD_02000 [archaeon]